MQVQRGGTDCGAFAIAVATSLHLANSRLEMTSAISWHDYYMDIVGFQLLQYCLCALTMEGVIDDQSRVCIKQFKFLMT